MQHTWDMYLLQNFSTAKTLAGCITLIKEKLVLKVKLDMALATRLEANRSVV